MAVFPISIVTKEDTPERLLALANVPEKNKFLASDINQIIAALKELDGRGKYIADSTGKKWWTRKGDGNQDSSAFQPYDKIEGWVDDERTEWVEGVILASSFVGVSDLANSERFFETNRKTIIS